MGGWGEGQLLSLRQKDAGQRFIGNHSNVFAVFRIQNPGGGGVPGRWGKNFHLSSRLHGALVLGQLLTSLQEAAPVCVSWVLTLRGSLGACAPVSLRVGVVPGPVPSN